MLLLQQRTKVKKKSPTLQALATSQKTSSEIMSKEHKRKIDPNKPVSAENIKAIIEEQSFKNMTRVAAFGKCKGIKRLASFEGEENVAVVTIWTEKLTRLASALVANDFSHLRINVLVTRWNIIQNWKTR